MLMLSPCLQYTFPYCLTIMPFKDHLRDSTVHTCMGVCGCICVCVCVCVSWRQSGSLVCRPQIYGAVTLAEESTLSSPARDTDKRKGFMLSSHSSWPLTPSLWCTSMSCFYLDSLDLSTSHHPHTHPFSVRRFFLFFFSLFLSHFTSCSETGQRSNAANGQKS